MPRLILLPYAKAFSVFDATDKIISWRYLQRTRCREVVSGDSRGQGNEMMADARIQES